MAIFQKWPIICDSRTAVSLARHALSLIATSLYYSIQSLQHTKNMKFHSSNSNTTSIVSLAGFRVLDVVGACGVYHSINKPLS